MRPNATVTTILLGAAVAAFAQELPRPIEARLVEPASGSMTGLRPRVHAQVDCGSHGAWRLLAVEGGQSTLLAEGQGPAGGETPLWSGTLETGRRLLRLEVVDGGEQRVDELSFFVAADQLPGWPIPATAPASGRATMPEAAFGGLLGARHGAGGDELLLLDGAGSCRPGWPVELGGLSVELPADARPLVLEEHPDAGVFLSTKTRLLAWSADGALRAEAELDSPPACPPLLHWSGMDEARLLLVVAGDQSAELRVHGSDLALLDAISLPGQACKGLAPALADWTDDGVADLLVPLLVDGDLRVALVNLATGGVSVVLELPGLVPLALAAGELTGDMVGDAVLVGAGGRIVAFDREQVHFSWTLAQTEFSPPALVDLDGDGAQEVYFGRRDAGGACSLQGVHGDGSPCDGFAPLDLDDDARLARAPVWYRSDDGAPRLVVALEPADAVRPRRFFTIDAQGGVADPGFLLPGRLTAPPRLLDLDGDGRLELAAASDDGTLALWPLGAPDGDVGHAWGDRRQSGCWLQPLLALPAESGSICGRVRLDSRLESAAALRLVDLRLQGGELALRGPAVLQGPCEVSSGAVLELAGEALGVDPASLRLDGRLRLAGEGVAPGELPAERRPESGLLERLELRPSAEGVLELRDCLVDRFEAEFRLDAGRLELRDSWWLGPAGLVLDGARIEARGSLLMAEETALWVRDGGQALLVDTDLSGADCGLRVDGGAAVLHGGRVLTCVDGLRLGTGATLEADSTHFQGNGHDVIATLLAGAARLTSCDFVEARLAPVRSVSGAVVDARHCWWAAERPVEGNVLLDPALDEPVKPVERPLRVETLGAGPMVDGDEPLEWTPVVFTESGLPVRVEYRVYRLDDPWAPLPATPAVQTASTWWRDPESRERACYRVTAVMGKPAGGLSTPDETLE